MPTYQPPGVYREETATPLPPLRLPACDLTAFVGACESGPLGEPLEVGDWRQFKALFGGDWPGGQLPLAVRLYFRNGGRRALILRCSDEVDASLLAPLEPHRPDLLCLPAERLPEGTVAAAQTWCQAQGCFLLVDPPAEWETLADLRDGHAALSPPSAFAALYYPRLRLPDRAGALVPCGAVAGVIQRVARSRGLWHHAAGLEAPLLGVAGFAHEITRFEQEEIAPWQINLLRRLRDEALVWGARTRMRDGERHYLAVERFLLALRRTLEAALAERPQALASRAGALLTRLHQAGALRGARPEEAWFLRQEPDGLLLGLALLRPAEFRILKITSGENVGPGDGGA